MVDAAAKIEVFGATVGATHNRINLQQTTSKKAIHKTSKRKEIVS